ERPGVRLLDRGSPIDGGPQAQQRLLRSVVRLLIGHAQVPGESEQLAPPPLVDVRHDGPIDVAGLGTRGGRRKRAFDDRHTLPTRVMRQTLNQRPGMPQAPATTAASVRNCCSYRRAYKPT